MKSLSLIHDRHETCGNYSADTGRSGQHGNDGLLRAEHSQLLFDTVQLRIDTLQQNEQWLNEQQDLARQSVRADPCDKVLNIAPSNPFTLLAHQPSYRRDELRSRFDQGTSHTQNSSQLPSFRRQHVGLWNSAGLQSACQRLGINAISLAPMLTDPQLPTARGIYQHNFVAPFSQEVVHEPRLAASLDSDLRRRLVWSEQRLQRFKLADRRTVNDLSLGQLTISCLSRA
jgi:hypothetical protein